MNELDANREALRAHFGDQKLSERDAYIRTLRSAVKAFEGARVAAAKALEQIRDKKLYWPQANLKDFCKVEFGWTEQRAHQVIKFSEIRAALPDKTKQLLSNEGQARELASVPENKRAEVLEEASRDGEVTAKSIRKKASEISERAADWGIVDNDGYPVPYKARPYWNRKAEVQEAVTLASKLRTLLRNIPDGERLYYNNKIRPQTFIVWLDQIFSELTGILPAYVCFACKGESPKVNDCGACKSTGVISEFKRKSVLPEEAKAREAWLAQDRETYVAAQRGEDPF